MKELALFASPPHGAFRAMLWKELRQNFKWAALGFLIVAAAQQYEISGLSQGLSDGENGAINAQLYMRLLDQLQAWAKIVAFLLGMAQILPENRGDKWGFLSHRPVRRSDIFFAKAVSGIGLYLLATVTPLLGAALWVSTPGHLAIPFYWKMTLPAFAEILCDITYYFAAMFMCMREARWYGTRTMGVGAAILCSFAVSGAVEFWQAAAISVIGVLVTGVAARGVFVSGGRYESQGRFSRAAAVLAVASGLGFVGLGITEIARSLLPSAPGEGRRSYSVTSDGTMVEIVFRYGVTKVNDLQGREIPRLAGSEGSNALQSGLVGEGSFGINPSEALATYSYYGSNQRFFRTIARRRGDSWTVRWYYIKDKNLLAAYDSATGMLLGWMGPDGFSDAGASLPRGFGTVLLNGPSLEDGLSEPVLAFSDAVYRLHLDEKRIERIFAPGPGESVLGAKPAGGEDDIRAFRGDGRFDAIATTRGVIVQSGSGERILFLPHDPLAKGYGTLSVTRALQAPGKPTFVWYSVVGGTLPKSEWREKPPQITRYDETGAPPEHYTLPPSQFRRNPAWLDVVVDGLATPLGAQSASEMIDTFDGYLEQGPWTSPAKHFTFWLLPLFVSAVFATLAFARCRIYGFSGGRLTLWTLLSFVAGPLGFVTMMTVIEWPPREECASCGRRRLAVHERCAHCGSPFALPLPDGTEIFEKSAADDSRIFSPAAHRQDRNRGKPLRREIPILDSPPHGPFRALVWKELRQNVKWAGLGLLITSYVVFSDVLYFSRSFANFSSYTTSESRFPLFVNSVQILAVILAFLLGLAHLLPENRGDKWGFLAHKPVSRTAIFLAKVVSGIVLYLTVVLVPLIGAAGWASMPGHLAMPFYWEMTLPAIASILGGIAYYFAALFVCMREARWYGTKVMGLGAAIICSYAIADAEEFWQAAALSAAGALITGVAAWGTFLAGGRFADQPPIYRCTAVVTVAAGLAFAGWGATELTQSLWYPRFTPGAYTSYEVTPDGELVQTVRRGLSIVRVNDLEGNALAKYQSPESRGQIGHGILSVHTSIDPGRRARIRYQDMARSLFEVRGSPSTETLWYYDVKKNLLAAFDAPSATLLGWMGPDGFSEAGKKPPPAFSGAILNVASVGNRYAFSDAIYRFDLEGRRIYRIFSPSPGESILGSVEGGNIGIKLPFGRTGSFKVIVTTQGVRVWSLDGEAILNVPHDSRAQGYGSLTVSRVMTAPGKPTFLWYAPLFGAPSPPNGLFQVKSAVTPDDPFQVTRYDENGTLTGRYTLSHKGVSAGPDWRTLVVYGIKTPLGVQAFREVPRLLGYADYRMWPFASNGLALWPLPLLLSLSSAAFTFARGRAYFFSKGRLAIWTSIAFIAGPLGLATMLAVIEWPRLEKCLSCGKRRNITSDQCGHCDASYAPPPLDGTEIFDRAQA